MTQPLYESDIKSLKLVNKGKVRELYEVDDKNFLIVTSDRISAFDFILPTPVPRKAEVLTTLSKFWFDLTKDIVDNHLTGIDPESVVETAEEKAQVKGRSLVVKRCKPLPIEAIVRGYIVGSGWKEYQAEGTVCGIQLPEGLQQADKLPEVIFTPSTKAEIGDHDENISFDKMVEMVGEDLAKKVRDTAIAVYTKCADYARSRGIIIADTKFEFGLDENDNLILIDEVLTPDSSRFWPESEYKPGSNPPSYDKQFVRDWLESAWDKTGEPPVMPEDVQQKTTAKYMEAVEKITGKPLA